MAKSDDKSPPQATVQSVVDVSLCRLHDNFNLIVLPVIALANLHHFLSICDFGSVDPVANGFVETYAKINLATSKGSAMWGSTPIYWMFTLYMIVDIVWLLVLPQTVASPRTIVVHHLFALMGVYSGVLEQQFSWWCSLGLLVEINTVFLLLRRYYGETYKILNFLFWTTWVLIRNIIYPISTTAFVFEYLEYSRAHKTYLNSGLQVLLTMLLLNILFCKWTFDMLMRGQKKDKGL